MVELKNVSLFFAGNRDYLLRDISWRIEDNEKWILFGRNGSGKTKLLEIIAGYRYPSEGEVIRFGNRIGFDMREMRKRIGYMGSALKDTIPAGEKIIDVVLSGLHASVGLYVEPDANEKRYAMDLLASMGMEERASDNFKVLSDGEKQRVIMLRAFVNQPDLLIFDEPAMSLDLSSREDLLTAIEKLSAFKRVSLIYVTHHVEEITPLFSKIFIIDGGRCYYSGDIDDGIDDMMLSGIFGREIKVTKSNGRYYSMIG
jgi:iron complex transport system ATP-binding protein